MKLKGDRVIPENDPIYDYAETVGISEDMLKLCWREFKRQHEDGERSSTRQKDWRATFRNCVRRNWYRIWWMNHEGEMAMTSAGRTLQKAHEKESA